MNQMSVTLTSLKSHHNTAMFLFHVWGHMNNFFLLNGIERDVGDQADQGKLSSSTLTWVIFSVEVKRECPRDI